MEITESVASSSTYSTARRHPRFLLSLPMTLTRKGEPDQPVTHGLSLDLSRGGASAVLCGQPAVGETIRLSLRFEGAPLETLALVRHSGATRCGFEFLDLSNAQRQLIEDRLHDLEGHSWPWQPQSGNAASMPSGRHLRKPSRG